MTAENRRVLVVDDDESIRIMVEHVLRRHNYQVDSARDGFEAIDKLARDDYGTILLDLMMPRLGGLAVLEFLERHHPELGRSVIVMTANVPGATEARRAGRVARVLSKPFDLTDLLDQVRSSASGEAP